MDKLYRYTVNGQGLYEAVKSELFNVYGYDNKPWKIIKQASKWLLLPYIYTDTSLELKSYFTELGNQTFKETVLPIIVKYLPNLNIQCQTKDIIDLSHILYSDENQVVERCEQPPENLYAPPMSTEELKIFYPRLLADPVHRWRAETGIELIHKEPTLDELERIWQNWQLMSKDMKHISDEKSFELFGIDNKTHYDILLKEYQGT